MGRNQNRGGRSNRKSNLQTGDTVSRSALAREKRRVDAESAAAKVPLTEGEQGRLEDGFELGTCGSRTKQLRGERRQRRKDKVIECGFFLCCVLFPTVFPSHVCRREKGTKRTSGWGGSRCTENFDSERGEASPKRCHPWQTPDCHLMATTRRPIAAAWHLRPSRTVAGRTCPARHPLHLSELERGHQGLRHLPCLGGVLPGPERLAALQEGRWVALAVDAAPFWGELARLGEGEGREKLCGEHCGENSSSGVTPVASGAPPR